MSNCRATNAKTAAAARKHHPTAALDAAKHWYRTERSARNALVLLGKTGVGKSVAAAWCVMEWGSERPWWRGNPGGPLKPAVVWLYVPPVQALTLVLEENQRALDNALAAELLVLDEVVLEAGKAGAAAVRTLIARRLDSGRPVVLTTNLDAAQLREALGSNISDRLRQCGRFPRLPAESMRGAA